MNKEQDKTAYRFFMRWIQLTFTFLLIYCGQIQTASANSRANRFVSTTGTNDDTCSVLVSPCRDIAHAISVASANDTILIFAGSYNETLSIDKSLTLRGFGSCDRCVALTPTVSSDNVITVQGAIVNIEQFDVSGGKRGIFVSGGTATIFDSAIHGNSSDSGGGGIYVSSGNVNIHDSSIYDNETQGSSGGGIYLANSIGTIDTTTIRENRAVAETSGGGIYMFGSSQLHMENSTVSGNSAESDGGGIFSTGETELFNVTITNNVANVDGDAQTGDGGGIYHNTGSIELRNSIIAANVDRLFGGSDVDFRDCRGTLTSQGYNLIGYDTCNIIGNQTGNITTATLPAVNPQLDGLSDNGGATLTHALQDDSPAVDAGRPLGCLGIGNLQLTEDQRGEARPVGNTCDMGAFENQTVPTAIRLNSADTHPTSTTPSIIAILMPLLVLSWTIKRRGSL